MIVTSRRTVTWPGVTSVAIDTLPRAEAIKLLQRGLERPEDRLSAAQWDALADAVGDLPLVLEILNAALADTVESARNLHARITRELDPAAVAEELRDLVKDVAERDETDLETLAVLQPHLQAAVVRSMERGTRDPWEAAWTAQVSWDEATRQRAGGLAALFPSPTDLSRNRRWWPLLEGLGLRALLAAWGNAGLEIAAMESGLWSYLEAREDDRDAQAQILQAFETLQAPGGFSNPPQPPLAPPFYTRFFHRCGLPPGSCSGDLGRLRSLRPVPSSARAGARGRGFPPGDRGQLVASVALLPLARRRPSDRSAVGGRLPGGSRHAVELRAERERAARPRMVREELGQADAPGR